jgi:serine/threonine protein kinase
VQLFDFGLCRELPEKEPVRDKTYHMSGVGTKRYMAPEVFLGKHYNLKADVYSWAIVFHCMLSLEKPYDMCDAQLYKQSVCIEGARPPIYPEWPEEIQQLCRKGWAQEHEDRLTMEEARERLERLRDQMNVDEPRTGADEEESISVGGEKAVEDMTIEDVIDLLCMRDNFCMNSSPKPSPNPSPNPSQNPSANPSSNKNANGKSILRMLEGEMMRASAPYERHITSYPNLKHLRSAYL